MGGALETFRRTELRSGDPLGWHPVNQKMAKGLREKRERGRSPKVERAIARKHREQEAQKRFMNELPKYQFDRALSHIIYGTASEEDINYVARNISKHEQIVSRLRANVGDINGGERKTRRVTLTQIDFNYHIAATKSAKTLQ